jgi:hypothetical protein
LTGFGVRGSAFGVEGRCIAARARPLTALALAALLGLLAACSSSPYHNPPRYTLPKDFNAAARQLIGAVAFGGVGYQDVGGNELVLRWREQRFRAAASMCGRLKWEFMPPGNGVKLAQIHGAKDESVTVELAKQGVEGARERGYEVEYFEDAEAGHEITPGMVEQLRGWLGGVIT